MSGRRKAAPGHNGPARKRRSDATHRVVRNASPLEAIFDRATNSIESRAQGDAAFAPFIAHIRALKEEYATSLFDATPNKCIELKKRMFAVQGVVVTDEMKKTIEEEILKTTIFENDDYSIDGFGKSGNAMILAVLIHNISSTSFEFLFQSYRSRAPKYSCWCG
ncbi:hypothetical protein CAEBREN_23144 [Caenorhabditis brenneri]|uniref:Uncharacterized protein n=1 Tax=Caenorhabditis brenneri TaxID=135651 RepID=G0MWI6_CAEBE|nr:hypothetical protein CAEBREN_23144 [Caenorhabditis brenneri]